MKLFGHNFAVTRQPAPAAPDTQEKAELGGSLNLFSRYGIQVVEDGQLSIYEYRELMRDAQVKAAVSFKSLARLASGWDIEPASDDPRDVEIADFIRDNFEQMTGTMTGFLRRAMLAMAYGLSVHEIALEQRTRGRWSGKVCLRELKWKRPEQFTCKVDEYGNLVALVQKVDGISHELDPQYFVIWAWDHEGDWQGRSDLVPAYRWSKAKSLVDWVWNVYLEKYATPTPIGKCPPGTKSADKQEILGFLENLHARKAVVVPNTWAIDMLESARNGADYESKIKYCDRMIARALLLPNLIMDEGESGSYSLGQQHADSFTWVLDAMGSELAEDVVGDQAIKPLVDWNFPDVDRYPRFKWRQYSTVDLSNISTALGILIDKRVIDPSEPWIREKLDMPPAAPDEEPNDDPPATDPPPADPEAPADDGGQLRTVELRSKTSAKHEPKVIKQRMTEIEDAAIAEIAATTEAQLSVLKQLIRRKRILENRDRAAIDALRLAGTGQIRAILEKALGDALHWGAADAVDELGRGAKTAGKQLPKLPETMGINLRQWHADPWAAPPEVLLSTAAIVKFWESKVPVQKALLNEYSREAFTMAGVHQDNLLQGAQHILSKAIRRGADYGTVEAELAALFKPFIAVEGALDPGVANPWRLATTVRTTMAEAYSSGRQNLFNDPEVGDFVVAYEYSAVMDDRTTPFCEAWNGVVLLASDPRISQLTPPNHYGCRALWIPIVRGEPFEVTVNVPSIQPAEGFAFGGCQC